MGKGKCCVKHLKSSIFFFLLCLTGLVLAEPKVEVVWEAPVHLHVESSIINLTVYRDPEGDISKDRIILWNVNQAEVFDREGKSIAMLPGAARYAVSPQGRYIFHYPDIGGEEAYIYRLPGMERKALRMPKDLLGTDAAMGDSGFFGIFGYDRDCYSAREYRCPKKALIMSPEGRVIYTSPEGFIWWIHFSNSGGYWAILLSAVKGGINMLYFGSLDGVLWSKPFDRKKWSPAFLDAYVDQDIKTIALKGGENILMNFDGAVLRKYRAREAEPLYTREGLFLLSSNLIERVREGGIVEPFVKLPSGLQIPIGYAIDLRLDLKESRILLSFQRDSWASTPHRTVIFSTTRSDPIFDEEQDFVDATLLDERSFVVLRPKSLRFYRIHEDN